MTRRKQLDIEYPNWVIVNKVEDASRLDYVGN